eukprot:TRINITY_DN175_c0_g1_i1.p3 TRINITY_DN175_c0_g1~~TRINITY_DN175_c0_g1_i1.p3  ORF type:complete len:148 (-),score=27.84 TRINITY_DN175_c0_g1_i1:355-798(-)
MQAVQAAVGGTSPVHALLRQMGEGNMVDGLGKLLRDDLGEEYAGLVGSKAGELQQAGFAIGDQMVGALLEKYGGEMSPIEGERSVPDNVAEESKKLLEANVEDKLLHPVLQPLLNGVLTPIMDPDFKEKLSMLIAKKKLSQYCACLA